MSNPETTKKCKSEVQPCDWPQLADLARLRAEKEQG
jgi:hypothetical protein